MASRSDPFFPGVRDELPIRTGIAKSLHSSVALTAHAVKRSGATGIGFGDRQGRSGPQLKGVPQLTGSVL
jgi:hypothetical protein